MRIVGSICMVAGVLMGGGAVPAPAQLVAKTVEAWRDAEWARATPTPSLGAYSIVWRDERPSYITEAEFEDLKRRVAGRPEHPDRHELEIETERRRTGKPEVQRCRLFGDGDGRWRYSTEWVRSGYASDSVLTERAAWRMVDLGLEGKAKSLSQYDRRRLREDGSNEDVRNDERVFMPQVGLLLFGGFSLGRVSEVRPGPVSVQGNRWSFRAERYKAGVAEPTYVLHYEGDWDAAAGRGLVRVMTTEVNVYRPEYVGSKTLFKEWKRHDASGLWHAGRADELGGDGRVTRSYVVESFDPLPAGGFAAVVRTPEPGRPDGVRGPVDITRVADFKRGTLRERDAEGNWKTTTIATTKPVDRTRALRIAGWVALGGCVALLAIWRLRRKGRAAAGRK
ncbi:MAG: hypothetical protein FJ255_05225 [Phycisphaerae bacterium]|nr:hypothetical protein [Phycisphaerae bacterium]